LARLNARINWERKLRSGAMRVDVAPMVDLMVRLGNPERAFRSIHVAGTKGKGSVARLLGEGLREAGYSVGVYASPHVERLNERVHLDQGWIDDAALAAALFDVLEAREAAERVGTEGAGATWFDLVTAAAFVAFRAAAVDWAVVEVGLGGRLDSTNVIHGDLCVITSIDLEHTDILGSTRVAIAREKAGILKVGCVLALGVPADRSRGAQEDAGAEIARIAANLGIYWEVVPPTASFAATNQALARRGLELLGKRGWERLGPDCLTAAAIARAQLPGRLEVFSTAGVTVVLDGAHVASSVASALRQLSEREFAKRPPQVVLALGQDKDAASILKTLSGVADRVHCTSVEGSLHRDPAQLAALAADQGLVSQAHTSPTDALSNALERAQPDGWVLVIGSLHLVGALRGRLVPA